MAEYINREAVLAEMTSKPLPNDASHLYLAMRGIVSKAPTADVAEVKHGEWIQNQHCKRIYYCSECGRHIEDGSQSQKPQEFFPYCHCGAKMDGVDHFADIGKKDIEITDFHIGNVSKMVLPWFSADNKSLLEKVLFFHKMDYPSEMDMELIVIIEGAMQPTILFYDGINFYSEEANGDICFHKVTHWMPLPAPPEKGDVE